jgi:hypothetical protein
MAVMKRSNLTDVLHFFVLIEIWFIHDQGFSFRLNHEPSNHIIKIVKDAIFFTPRKII